MFNRILFNSVMIGLLLSCAVLTPLFGQTKKAETVQTDVLQGDYGSYRANNDLLYYHLDVRVDPAKKFLSGKNTIRFKMLKDDNRIQIDLHSALDIDKILYENKELKYTRDAATRAVYIDFPETLRKGQIYAIDFYYSGNPIESGRFGGITFKKDPTGNFWVNTSCEGVGASIWFPNKDQWRDEVENMRISVSIPNDLTDVSNGKFAGKT
ncbi:MAG: M1 family metallopeptidase, partial [Pyrinomonadaceae bacterium]